jgi:hypothetical protein
MSDQLTKLLDVMDHYETLHGKPPAYLRLTQEEYKKFLLVAQPLLIAAAASDGSIRLRGVPILCGDEPVPTPKPDMIKHPPHYNSHPSGVECRTIVQEFPFNIGTAIKHLWRAGLKPGSPTLVDLEKAKQYINFEIERITKQQDKELAQAEPPPFRRDLGIAGGSVEPGLLVSNSEHRT